MSNMKYSKKPVYDVKTSGYDAKTFVLWRQVLMAYVSPAVMAGIGGWITGDKGLQFAALTTIGGASAVMAWMLGLWLRNRGGHTRWIVRIPRLVVVGMFAVAGALVGLFAAGVTSGLAEILMPNNPWSWVDRVWIDFPLSGFIASTIVTWRWRLAVTTNSTFKGEDKQ